MTTTSPPTAPPDRDALERLAVRFAVAMLDSADGRKLGMRKWDRLLAALESAASMPAFGEAVTKAKAKLEVDGTLSESSGAAILALRQQLAGDDAYAAWADLCQREGAVIIALARQEWDELWEQRKKDKAARGTPRAQEQPPEGPEY